MCTGKPIMNYLEVMVDTDKKTANYSVKLLR